MDEVDVSLFSESKVFQKIREIFGENFFKPDKEKEKIVGILFKVCYVLFVFLCIGYLTAIIFLRRTVFINSILYILPMMAFPILLWVYSTIFKSYGYHEKKVFRAKLFVVNAVMLPCQGLYSFVWRIFIPLIHTRIKVNEFMTEGMVTMLDRAALVLFSFFPMGIIIYALFQFLFNEETQEKIAAFKLTHVIDTRENKEYLYDFDAVKDLETGKPLTIFQNDRMVHMLVNGATGTGKTSSTLLKAINRDLTIKKRNMEQREKAYLKMVKEGKADVIGPCAKGLFNEEWIAPRPEYIEEYKTIQEKFPDCGVTVVAPDPDTTDDVVRIARAKGFKVNVIDPEPDEITHEMKKGLVGINPFFIPPGLSEEDEIDIINMRAQYFYDVMEAMSKAKGSSSDQYFEGVNNVVAVTIAKIVMKGCMLMNNRSANILDVKRCVDDYSQLEPYVKAIENHYKLHVDIRATAADKKKGPATADDLENTKPVNTRKETEADRQNYYYDDIKRIRNEFMGVGPAAEKMNKDAMGLRNMLNNFANSPRILRMLMLDKYIDFDRILRKGEVTVVNTSLKMGSSLSTAFGLFFLLNLKQAVLSRPINTRIPHFWYIDEFALFLSPAVEQMFTLFRKFQCGMTVAIQSLDQFEKDNTTKYLRGVITVNCGTHILFGRGNTGEMKFYQELAGTEKIQLAQKTVSQTSLLAPNTSYSESERITPTDVNVLEGTQVRNRDFQEVTIFTVKNGRVMRPYIGSVDFLDRDNFDIKKQVPRHVAWYKYVTKNDIGNKLETEDLAQTYNDPSVVRRARGSSVTSNIDPELNIQGVAVAERETKGITQQQLSDYSNPSYTPAAAPIMPASQVGGRSAYSAVPGQDKGASMFAMPTPSNSPQTHSIYGSHNRPDDIDDEDITPVITSGLPKGSGVSMFASSSYSPSYDDMNFSTGKDKVIEEMPEWKKDSDTDLYDIEDEDDEEDTDN